MQVVSCQWVPWSVSSSLTICPPISSRLPHIVSHFLTSYISPFTHLFFKLFGAAPAHTSLVVCACWALKESKWWGTLSSDRTLQAVLQYKGGLQLWPEFEQAVPLQDQGCPPSCTPPKSSTNMWLSGASGLMSMGGLVREQHPFQSSTCWAEFSPSWDQRSTFYCGPLAKGQLMPFHHRPLPCCALP